MAYAKMAKEIGPQTEAFIYGISEIIPIEALSIIDEKDLGIRLAGVPNIDGLFRIKFAFNKIYTYSGRNGEICCVKHLYKIR